MKEPSDLEKEVLTDNYNLYKNTIYFVSDTSKYYINSHRDGYNLYSSNMWACVCQDYSDALFVIINTNTNDYGIKYSSNKGMYFGKSIKKFLIEDRKDYLEVINILLKEYSNISKFLERINSIKSLS